MNNRKKMGNAVESMINAWADYAAAYRAEYGQEIRHDGFLGPEWRDVGKSLAAMLNGELGAHDGGTLDRCIGDTFLLNGYTYEGEKK